MFLLKFLIVIAFILCSSSCHQENYYRDKYLCAIAQNWIPELEEIYGYKTKVIRKMCDFCEMMLPVHESRQCAVCPTIFDICAECEDKLDEKRELCHLNHDELIPELPVSTAEVKIFLSTLASRCGVPGAKNAVVTMTFPLKPKEDRIDSS